MRDWALLETSESGRHKFMAVVIGTCESTGAWPGAQGPNQSTCPASAAVTQKGAQLAGSHSTEGSHGPLHPLGEKTHVCQARGRPEAKAPLRQQQKAAPYIPRPRAEPTVRSRGAVPAVPQLRGTPAWLSMRPRLQGLCQRSWMAPCKPRPSTHAGRHPGVGKQPRAGAQGLHMHRPLRSPRGPYDEAF